MKGFVSSINYKIMAFGGAGRSIIDGLQKHDVPLDRIDLFDTDKTAIGLNGFANRYLLGNNRVKGTGTNGDAVIGRRIFEDHRELLNKMTNEDCLYVITGALGGGTFSAIAPLLLEMLEKKNRKVVLVTTLPESETAGRLAVAFNALQAINHITDKVLLYHGKMVVDLHRQHGKEEGYAMISQMVASGIISLLSKTKVRIIASSDATQVRAHDNFERIKTYIDGHKWIATHKNDRSYLGPNNVALLETIYSGTSELTMVSPRKFEELTAAILEGAGYDTKLTPPTRDGGVDIHVKTYPPLGGTPFSTVFQAKLKGKGKIQCFEVQQLEGAKRGVDADRAAFVSSVDYSKDSIAYAKKQKIDLFKFYDLLERYMRLDKG